MQCTPSRTAAMYLLIIAVVVLMLKIYDIPPVNSWLWMEVLLPSFMALLWKLWADWSGYTRRRLRARHARRRSARYVQDKGLCKINATPRPPSR
ncbi:TIGR04438 family Trp-rich protein [Comamonas sp.]|uniref:TIGR04438 family Trp-rich protein n=1 Tax=Comamonas sp. TaxID=34028 RepID=UPI0028986CBE|nr:TIGR04438 family Trp-rich protein [Comamonas sp.]